MSARPGNGASSLQDFVAMFSRQCKRTAKNGFDEAQGIFF